MFDLVILIRPWYSGQGSSGSYMYSGMDETSGELIVVGEWKFLHPSSPTCPLKVSEVPPQDSGRLMKQVSAGHHKFFSPELSLSLCSCHS